MEILLLLVLTVHKNLMKKVSFIIIIFICGIIFFNLSKTKKHINDYQTNGIDISEHQENVDFIQLKDQIDYVMIRSSYKTSTDRMFEENYQQATACDIDVGVYHYLLATTKEEAIDEANYVLSLVEGKNIPLGIYVDIEDVKITNLSKKQLTEIVLTFMQTIEPYYDVGYYTNYLTLITNLDYSKLEDYPLWIAYYGETIYDIYKAKYWQYTNKGNLDGINGDVDLNIKLG